MEMEKTFNPQAVESEIYRDWESSGAFEAHRVEGKKPFTIVMPPPNITGQLHMGHALDCTLQDLAVRYHRMKGDPTLWLPGTDHAAIATEVKIVDAMRKEGMTKESLGRKGFLDRAWKWKEEYGGRIVTQQRRMGISCDWSRERFTMDEGCSKAVREVFVRLYEKGLIYRGNRLVNWCPCCESAISDAEVEYQEKEGNFWHLLYPVKETGEMLELATTRPETMLGDTAVAINAADPRYAHLHGCHVLLISILSTAIFFAIALLICLKLKKCPSVQTSYLYYKDEPYHYDQINYIKVSRIKTAKIYVNGKKLVGVSNWCDNYNSLIVWAKKCHIPVLAPNKKSNSSNSLDLNALSNNISMIVAVVVFAIMMIGAAVVFINSIS